MNRCRTPKLLTLIWIALCLTCVLTAGAEPATESAIEPQAVSITELATEALERNDAEGQIDQFFGLEAAAWGGPIAPMAAAVKLQQMSTCSDCDSPQNSCSPGPGSCNAYCQALTGENGFCNLECNCCVCPEIRPGDC